MYRMLIVEDERIVREGMRDLYNWDAMGIDVVGAVGSGEEALSFVSNQNIDILFTDIKLPGISGLELAKRLQTYNQELKVVINSAYHEFEYAKTAVDLAAYGFLLKPIEAEELEQVITKVLNTCNREHREKAEKERLHKLVVESMPFLKNKFFNQLISGLVDENTIRENLEYFGVPFHTGCYIAVVTEIDCFESLKDSKSQDDVHMIVFEVLECMDGFRPEEKSLSFHVSGNRFCTIFNLNAGNMGPRDIYEKTMSLAVGLQKRIFDLCKLEATVGIGKGTDRMSEIKNSYKTACDAVDYKFYLGLNQIIHYKDVYFNEKENSETDIESVEDKILSSLELRDRQSLNQNIALLFEHLKMKSASANIYTRNICIKLLARTSVKLLDMHESFEKIFGREMLIWEKIMRFENIFDIQQWMKNILNAIIDYLSERHESNNKKIIGEILQIIDENYNKNLVISDISNEVFLSPNYISALFKKEMGVSFTDFLVKYRLEKAKQLLKETNMKVYQIGSTVGYSNISYFCSIFKTIYGVSPSEYREKS